MNVPGYDAKEKFEFGVITSFAYPIENSGKFEIIMLFETLSDKASDEKIITAPSLLASSQPPPSHGTSSYPTTISHIR